MKIAVSDFDGTMYFHQQDAIPPINLKAVDAWRKAGNIFVFCTGRDMRSLIYEISNHKLVFDYIICNNGGTIFDNKLNVLKAYPLDKQAWTTLVKSDIAKHSWHIMYSCVNKMRTTIQHYRSPLLNYFEAPKYKHQQIIKRISINQAIQELEPEQISLAYDSEEQARFYIQQIEKQFDHIFSANLNINYVDVCAYGVTKAQGIHDLLALKHWQDEEVLTIGDGQNDVPMIEEFNGFSLQKATKQAQEAAHKLYDSLGAMLLDNLK